MNRVIAKYIASSLFLMALLFLFSSCRDMFGIREDRRIRFVAPSGPTSEYVGKAGSNAKLTLSNYTFKPVGAHEFLLTGTIAAASYEVTDLGAKTDLHYMGKGRSVFGGDQNTEWHSWGKMLLERPGTSETVQWMPNSVVIRNPFGRDITAEVSAQGKFQARIRLPDNYFAEPPRSKPYVKVLRHDSRTIILMVPHKGESNLYDLDRSIGSRGSIFHIKLIKDGYVYREWETPSPHRMTQDLKMMGTHIETELEFPKVYFHERDLDAATSFAKSLSRRSIGGVRLSIKDQLTRRSVSADVTVSPVSSINENQFKQSFRTALLKEFGGDEELVTIGMKELYSAGKPLFSGESINQTTSLLSFLGVIGNQFKIETVHSQYLFFSGVLSINMPQTVDKTLLIVEKGAKIRIESINAREGGVIIDDK